MIKALDITSDQEAGLYMDNMTGVSSQIQYPIELAVGGKSFRKLFKNIVGLLDLYSFIDLFNTSRINSLTEGSDFMCAKDLIP